jgi:hypothetical protein
MVPVLIVVALNIAFGLWVVRLIAKDPANLRKRRPPLDQKPPGQKPPDQKPPAP